MNFSQTVVNSFLALFNPSVTGGDGGSGPGHVRHTGPEGRSARLREGQTPQLRHDPWHQGQQEVHR